MAATEPTILYLITKANFGGAQRYVLELATAMKSHGYRPMIASNGQGDLVARAAAQQIPHHTIKHFQRDINPLKEISALFEVIRLCRQVRPNSLHVNSSKAGLLGALAGRLTGVRQIIFTAHGWPFREKRGRLWRTVAWLGSYATALLAHQVILVSYDDRSHTNLPGARHKCTVIHNGVAANTYRDRDVARAALFDTATITKHANDIWLVTTAELHPNKNQLSAIRAVIAHNHTQSPKIFYVLMGDGDSRTAIANELAASDAKGQIVCLGYVDNPASYLHAFDIFILPSKKEGLPYALLDAGRAGLACIASRRGGIPEIIADRRDGLLIEPDDQATIARALTTLANDQTVRQRYGQHLQHKLEQKFTVDAMVTATAAVYASRV